MSKKPEVLKIYLQLDPDNETIKFDNSVFQLNKTVRNAKLSDSVTFKCQKSTCLAKIRLNKMCDKLIYLDLQHNHTVPNKKPEKPNNSVEINKISNCLSKESSINKNKKRQNSCDNKSLNKSNNVNTTRPAASLIKSNNKNQTSSNFGVPNNCVTYASSDVIEHNASPGDVNRRLTELEQRNSYLTSKVNELSLNVTSVEIDSKLAISSSSKCKTVEKIFIFSDSHGRDLSTILRNNYIHPKCEVFSLVKPGACFSEVVKSIPEICEKDEFNKNDVVIVLAGTNNLSNLNHNANSELNLDILKPVALKTNIVICSIPTRFDDSGLSHSLLRANKILENKTNEIHGTFFECNSFLQRSYFTRHGLHMNKHGKRVFALKCASFIDDQLNIAPPSVSVGGSNGPSSNIAVDDVFDVSSFVIHGRANVPRTSPALHVNHSLLTYTPHNDPSAGPSNYDGYHTAFCTNPYSDDDVQELSEISVVTGNRIERDELNFQEINSTPII
uniref:Uncharacterized protein n=1 Tax=Cacopsylla melanoneura TaxID=428564 RepID=A0A8D8WJX3_9HEMI